MKVKWKHFGFGVNGGNGACEAYGFDEEEMVFFLKKIIYIF